MCHKGRCSMRCARRRTAHRCLADFPLSRGTACGSSFHSGAIVVIAAPKRIICPSPRFILAARNQLISEHQIALVSLVLITQRPGP